MKKYLLLISIAICFMPILSICQIIEWQRTFGGSDNERSCSIEQTADGGYILGGGSLSGISGNKTENSNGDSDYWLIKTDATGIIQWQKTIGGNDRDDLHSIQQTADGGYILGGNSWSNISGDKTENSNGWRDYWIIKTDATGNIQWQKTIGGDGEDSFQSIRQTLDGGYIIGGSSFSNISGDKTENSKGLDDYWLIKTDSVGNILWQKTIGGSGNDQLISFHQTSDGGYILGGGSNSNISGDKSESCMGVFDYWIVKTDSSGNIQWQNTIGGNDFDALSSIRQTLDGGYIVGGLSLSDISGDKTESCKGGFDYWIIKTDTVGNIQWQNTIGGNSHDRLSTIQQTMDGGYIVGGSSLSGISGDKSESQGANDFWIVKTNSSGTILWQNTLGGINMDELSFLQQTTDGGFILSGISNSNISGDKTENSNGLYDFWIIKFQNHFNFITGNLFIDTNGNNTKDAGEPSVINKLVNEITTGSFGFSEQNGNYTISLMDSGNFSVSPATLSYYNPVPITHNANFSGIQQTDSLNDFAFQPVGVFNDLCVTITPLGPFRAGFNANYQITYENVGTTTLNPTVIFFADDDVSFVSATPIANVITPDSVVWNFSPLTPFQTGSILVTVNIATGVPIGTMINSGAVIEPIAGDANTSCNYSFWEVFTTGSYDPNDILVDEDTLLTIQFPNPPYLEYVIRFQNTGNDTAFTVKILNPIDTFKLDLSTLEFIASSHPVNLNWITWERNMEFRFENILLPDSNVNEPESHGFVRYRIKPNSTLTVGDSIPNFAAIYFDYNAPVITNTAVTHIVLPSSLNEIYSSPYHLVLYPNPANSTLTIETGILSNLGSRLVISDVAGRTLFSKLITANSSNHKIDISSLSQGIYFVQVQAGERISRGIFVKE